MEKSDSLIYPTVKEVSEKIREIIFERMSDEENIVVSYIEGPYTIDSWTFSLSFALATDLMTEKTLNFCVIQNTNSREISVAITTGEKEGMRILYKSINKYPIPGIQKYLPNIINSSIEILLKNNN